MQDKIFGISYQATIFLSLENATEMPATQEAYSSQVVPKNPKLSHRHRLPDDLKRTVIRSGRTLLCGNQRRLCHSPFSLPYESRKICSAECRATLTIPRDFDTYVDFLDRESASIQIAMNTSNARNWINRSAENSAVTLKINSRAWWSS